MPPKSAFTWAIEEPRQKDVAAAAEKMNCRPAIQMLSSHIRRNSRREDLFGTRITRQVGRRIPFVSDCSSEPRVGLRGSRGPLPSAAGHYRESAGRAHRRASHP